MGAPDDRVPDRSLAPRDSLCIYTHSDFAGHRVPDHPESPVRYLAVAKELERRSLPGVVVVNDIPLASDDHLELVHDRRLIEGLDSLARQGGGPLDPDTWVMPDSVRVARRAVGAAIRAVDAIRDHRASRAVVAARPPGHHATRSRSMGFCLFNTIGIAAARARQSGFNRVAIIDWDVHHGNGTNDLFAADPTVFYASVHQFGDGFFPGTGDASDIGTGPGTGYTLNIPLDAGDGDGEFITAMRERIVPAVRAFRPDLLMISAGYDAHADDPLAQLQVSDNGFQTMSAMAMDLANELTNGRALIVLEGGYAPTTMARCFVDTIEIANASFI